MDFADDFGVGETVPAPALCPLSSTRVCTAFVRQGELVPGVGVGKQDQPGYGTASAWGQSSGEGAVGQSEGRTSRHKLGLPWGREQQGLLEDT